MGKLVTVNQGYQAVLLPFKGGLRNYAPGAQVTVTDAEYAAFNQATLNAITLTTSGLPDPARSTNDPQALSDTPNTTVSGAATANVGWNDWTLTGNVTSVTLAPANLKANPPVAGAAPGNVSLVAFRLTQDATGSRTVTWGSAFKFQGKAAPVLTTAANSVDILRFITFDGGQTFWESDRILNVG